MDENYLEAISACALNRIFGYSPEISLNLISTLGSSRAVFALSPGELREIFGPGSKYVPMICERELEHSERELDSLHLKGYSFIHIGQDCYPDALKECPDAPVGLYVRSSADPVSLFNSHPLVSIVGTRDISSYGKEFCVRIIHALGEGTVKPTIVSGMAIGVDITAHMAALGFGMPTIGVLPNGIDVVYPPCHSTAAQKISRAEDCALITDFPPGTSPIKVTFLRRNRIIAGLSRATILIESKARGGGMMTARLASGYGRDVFALPGRLDDVRSEGCNILISEKTAESIGTIPSFIRSLGIGLPERRKAEGLEKEIRGKFSGSHPADTVERLVRLAGAVKSKRDIDFEGLCRECGMDYSEVSYLAGILINEGIMSTDLMQRCSINFKIC